MATVFDIRVLWTAFKDVVVFLKERTDKNKKSIIKAHMDINAAYIKTYDYLKNRNGQYIPNVELAEIWNQASASVIEIDTGLGNMLFNKSRFWLHPELYVNLSQDSEIIELNQLIDEMEMLRMKLE